jgi:hypothetical protein
MYRDVDLDDPLQAAGACGNFPPLGMAQDFETKKGGAEEFIHFRINMGPKCLWEMLFSNVLALLFVKGV